MGECGWVKLAVLLYAVTLPACHDLQDVYHKQELVRTRGIRLFN